MTRSLGVVVVLANVLTLSCGSDKVTSVDVYPPAAVTDLLISSNDQTFSLSWTAPGDDGHLGRAAKYDIRYAAAGLERSWDSATPLPSIPVPSAAGKRDSAMVEEIGAGPWEFGLRTADRAGNWSKISNIVTSQLLPDTIPPAGITDLTVQTTGQGHYLRWTAPGDDGLVGRASRYDIRYSASDLTANWDAATVVSSPPAPGPAGSTDSVAVLGIGWGPWEFGIRTFDNVGNESGISNVVMTMEPVDTTPPATVTDLAVDLLTERSVILTWTAVGDDGMAGQAAEYDLRYSPDPITPATWPSATRVQGMTPPGPSGATESFAVSGLNQGTSYHFALIVLDDVQNPSGLSNQVVAGPSSPVQLAMGTIGTDDVLDPDWSPDGASIVFSVGSPRQLYVISSSGGTPVQYTFDPSGATHASWSPDGSEIAFTLGRGGSLGSVVALMSAQPSASAQILADHDSLSATYPRWSPNGSTVVYAVSASTGHASSASDIYTIPSGGGTPGRLGGGWSVFGIDWSPDGSQIVYSSDQDGTYDLWLMPSMGGGPSPLFTGPGREWYPRWSPDGSKIAFVDQQAVWVISPSGGTPIQITFGDEGVPYGNPAWSPDGSKLAYGTFDGTSTTHIWVLPVR
jgi:hypothetical protein